MIRNRRVAAVLHLSIAVLLVAVWLWPRPVGCAVWGQDTDIDGHCVLQEGETKCASDQAAHIDGHCAPCPVEVAEGHSCFTLIGNEL